MSLEQCKEQDRNSWDQFAASREHCGPYHLFGWKDVIESTYGHACPYLMSVQSGQVAGILPLTAIRSRFFGNSLTSLPFVDTAGVVAIDPRAQEELVSGAVQWCAAQGVDYLELRQVQPVKGEFRIDTHKLSLTMPLPDSTEAQWEAISSERRNRVRKAQKAGATAQIGGAELLPEFYDVWSHNMRDLGSPAHSRLWFERILAVFPDMAHVMILRHARGAVGACIALIHKGTLSVPWVSSLRRSFAVHSNDLLYWEAMCFAISRGCTVFDFGRSTAHSGNHTYKVRWGAHEAPIYWHYRSLAGGEPKLPGDDDVKFAVASWIWKRLPVPLANVMGPRIRKSVTR